MDLLKTIGLSREINFNVEISYSDLCNKLVDFKSRGDGLISFFYRKKISPKELKILSLNQFKIELQQRIVNPLYPAGSNIEFEVIQKANHSSINAKLTPFYEMLMSAVILQMAFFLTFWYFLNVRLSLLILLVFLVFDSIYYLIKRYQLYQLEFLIEGFIQSFVQESD
ncbi:MAG: hypothetical protein NXI20_14620 [bacterium]|nr:hypothetical protein [bacterium]